MKHVISKLDCSGESPVTLWLSKRAPIGALSDWTAERSAAHEFDDESEADAAQVLAGSGVRFLVIRSKPKEPPNILFSDASIARCQRDLEARHLD